MAAIGHFERELDSLMYPVTKEQLKAAAARLLSGLFGYDLKEAETRTNIFDEQRDIPTENEIEYDQEILGEMLKIGLFDGLSEEYIILHGKEEFDEWIGPFLRLVLSGHTEQSQSIEHMTECPDDRFCPAAIITCFVEDRIIGQGTTIEKNEIYIPYADEIIHMHTKIVKELCAMGVYDKADVGILFDDYQAWLESIEDFPITYDEAVFDSFA
jgi:hypothetical protein